MKDVELMIEDSAILINKSTLTYLHCSSLLTSQGITSVEDAPNEIHS